MGENEAKTIKCTIKKKREKIVILNLISPYKSGFHLHFTSFGFLTIDVYYSPFSVKGKKSTDFMMITF